VKIAAGILFATSCALAANTPTSPALSSVASPSSKEALPALSLSFERLAGFAYVLAGLPGPDGKPTQPPKQQIPENVRELDGKRVAITGFLLPFELKDGFVTQAVLLRSQLSCCYGVAPNFNEFVVITVSGRGVRPIMDAPVTLTGILRVGESYEDNLLTGIYRLDAERLDEVKPAT
jgi:hypothetical protein